MRGIARMVAAVLVIPLSGCSIGDVRRSPNPVATTAVPSSEASSVDAYRVYRVRVPVPDDHDEFQAEFTDAGNGYAMFRRCAASAAATSATEPTCAAILLVTADGGRSWRERALPHQRDARHQLYARGGRLLVHAEPHGWYLSTDRGQTFGRLPQGELSPAARSVLGGRFQVCCDDTPRKRVVEWVGDRSRPLPAQPGLPDLRTVGYAGGRLVAVGVRDGRPHAAISTDQGRSWRTTAVPPPASRLGGVSLEMNGMDAWLVGQPEDRTSFPWLWRFDGVEWRPASPPGHPPQARTAGAIGDGWLAVTGPAGWGRVGHGWYLPLDLPSTGELRVIEDGALCLLPETGPERVFWLGSGSGTRRLWTRVELVPE